MRSSDPRACFGSLGWYRVFLIALFECATHAWSRSSRRRIDGRRGPDPLQARGRGVAEARDFAIEPSVARQNLLRSVGGRHRGGMVVYLDNTMVLALSLPVVLPALYFRVPRLLRAHLFNFSFCVCGVCVRAHSHERTHTLRVGWDFVSSQYFFVFTCPFPTLPSLLDLSLTGTPNARFFVLYWVGILICVATEGVIVLMCRSRSLLVTGWFLVEKKTPFFSHNDYGSTIS